MTKIITVNDKMQRGYTYELVARAGDLPSNFNPTVTPKEMLELGVFGGKYMTDCRDEFPDSWFTNAKLNSEKYDVAINRFGVKAGKDLAYWRSKGWIRTEHDPRGWFQWYCRFYRGRRIEGYDEWQIKRWRNIKRHLRYITNRFDIEDWTGSPVRRQTLLHWGVLADGSISGARLMELFERT